MQAFSWGYEVFGLVDVDGKNSLNQKEGFLSLAWICYLGMTRRCSQIEHFRCLATRGELKALRGCNAKGSHW